jgi:hypothetical protein
MLVTWSMVRESYLKAPATLAKEYEDFSKWAADFEQRRGLNFSEDVRERARLVGKKVPYKEPILLPKKPRNRKSSS